MIKLYTHLEQRFDFQHFFLFSTEQIWFKFWSWGKKKLCVNTFIFVSGVWHFFFGWQKGQYWIDIHMSKKIEKLACTLRPNWEGERQQLLGSIGETKNEIGAILGEQNIKKCDRFDGECKDHPKFRMFSLLTFNSLLQNQKSKEIEVDKISNFGNSFELLSG